jgi:ABC-type polysaccharide/polyol phosphate export permease
MTLPLILAVRDIANGAKLAPIWWQIGLDQTASRFRRTLLGPFWLSANLVAISIALTFVFGGLFGSDYSKTFPTVISGLLCWSLIGQSIADAAPTFLIAAPMMQVQKLPLSFHLFLQLDKILINFAAQLITFWVLMAVFGLGRVPNWQFVPGLALVIFNCFFTTLLSSFAATRFRDIGFMIQFVVQILFFVSPVFWSPAQMSPSRKFVVEYNPFAHELDLLRKPLLGLSPSAGDWLWTLGLSLVLLVISLTAMSLYRKRVIFWL